MMKSLNKTGFLALAYSAILASSAFAFDSGSTGEDGALSPTEDVVIPLPPDGILNYTTINIPEGVTVRFGRNAANTPAYLLVQGDATINGTIDVSGRDGRSFSNLPPAAFAGGQSRFNNQSGENGQGPGSGRGCNAGFGGHGGSYAQNGQTRGCSGSDGEPYGNEALQPLMGGSGGGAGGVNDVDGRIFGTSGGSGGGATLIAVSGTLSLNGSILAVGGNGESLSEAYESDSISAGGGGSGGAVRLISTHYIGSGTINISGGNGGQAFGDRATSRTGGNGSFGRVSIEYETAASRPIVIPTDFIEKLPQPVFLDNLPTIRIVSIAEFSVPENPTGNSDIVLADNADSVVNVETQASNVPEGTTVRLSYINDNSNTIIQNSENLSLEDGILKTSHSVRLNQGNTRFTASLGFSVSILQARTLSRFTNGETVERVELASAMGGKSRLRLTTVSGREYLVDPAAAQ